MRKIKRTIAVMLALGLIASGVGTGSETSAKTKVKKPSIAKKATVMEEQQKSLKVTMSGCKLKSIKAKSNDKAVLKVKVKKKTKTVILTGVSTGTAKVTTTVKVTIKGKTKKFTLKTTVTVKEAVMSGYENIDVDYDVETGEVLINATFNAALGAISSFVPGGQVISGFLGSLWGDLASGGSGGVEQGLQQISADISSLRSHIDEEFEKVKTQIDSVEESLEAAIVNQSVIGSAGQTFDDLYTDLKMTAESIEDILDEPDDVMSPEEKAVYMASLIGKASDWNRKGNLVRDYMMFMNTLSIPTFKVMKAKKDLYEIVADSFINEMKSKIMFTGEAVKFSEPFIQRVTMLGLYAYSIVSQCLQAHQLVSKIPDATINSWTDEALKEDCKSIKSPLNFVNKQIVRINKKMFDEDCADSVTSHLIHYQNSFRTTFINKGQCSINFKNTLKSYPINWEGDFDSIMIALMEIEFGAGYENRNPNDSPCWWNTDYPVNIEDLCDYVFEKGKTLREFLSEVGFDLSGINENAFLYAVSNWAPFMWHETDYSLISGKEISINGFSFDGIMTKPDPWHHVDMDRCYKWYDHQMDEETLKSLKDMEIFSFEIAK